MFDEQGHCKHCPKYTPLVASQFHPPTGSLTGIQAAGYIDPYCVEMASKAMIFFGLDPGKFVHFLLGKYTGQHRDVRCTLDAIQDHIRSRTMSLTTLLIR